MAGPRFGLLHVEALGSGLHLRLWRRRDLGTLGQPPILVALDPLGADGAVAASEDEDVVIREPQDLVGVDEGALVVVVAYVLFVEHEVDAGASVASFFLVDGEDAAEFGEVFGGFVVVGGQGDSYVAGGEDGLVAASGGVDGAVLGEALGDEAGSDAVPGHDGEGGLEEREAPQERKLVEHEEELVAVGGDGAALAELKVAGEAAESLGQEEPHERPGAL